MTNDYDQIVEPVEPPPYHPPEDRPPSGPSSFRPMTTTKPATPANPRANVEGSGTALSKC